MMASLTSRRLMFASAAAACVYGNCMLFPKQSFADEGGPTQQNTLRERINKMNEQDAVRVRNLRIQDVLKWEAVKNNSVSIAQYVDKLDDDTLFELYYMTSFYHKPLSPEQKIRARNIFLRFYDQSKNEHQRSMFEALMNYFELL